MYYELYLDVLFFQNFLMDFLLILITKKVLRATASVGRMLLAAAAGSLLTCVAVLIRLPHPFLKCGIFFGLIPGAMLLAGIRIREKSAFARGMLTLYISGVLVGGVFTFLQQYVQVGSLFFVLAVVSYYLASASLKFLSMLFHFGEVHCMVTLLYGGRSCEGDAIIDTGNHLCDPVTGKAVSIVSKDLARELFEGAWSEETRMIPYRTIGKSNGTIAVLEIDEMRIEGDDEIFEKPMIAVSDDSSFGNRCDMILNPDI